MKHKGILLDIKFSNQADASGKKKWGFWATLIRKGKTPTNCVASLEDGSNLEKEIDLLIENMLKLEENSKKKK